MTPTTTPTTKSLVRRAITWLRSPAIDTTQEWLIPAVPMGKWFPK